MNPGALSDRSLVGIASLFMFVRRYDMDFRIRRCPRFEEERVVKLLDLPGTIRLSQRPGSHDRIEEIDRLRDMAGMMELYDLVSKIRWRMGPFRARFEPAVWRMPPSGLGGGTVIASLRVVFRLDPNADKAVIRIKLSGFQNESCLYLRDNPLFPAIRRFVKACSMDAEGTIFRW